MFIFVARRIKNVKKKEWGIISQLLTDLGHRKTPKFYKSITFEYKCGINFAGRNLFVAAG
ncbi:MAG: hypothetical protein DRP78_01680 [Candidatus Omnitrophota bacterium]|nr:MAG: hypothetical protein DRP78_01680 [Candidatus Omnitrophota bacterium]